MLPLAPPNASPRRPRHLSSIWEIAALVEVLERKGVLTRQEIYAAINELRQRHPEATILERPVRERVRPPTS